MPSRTCWCLLCVLALVSLPLVPLVGIRSALAATERDQVSSNTVRFDGIRKPPIPVSFLSHETSWITFLYPPSARERVISLFAQADDWRAELAEVLGRPPLTGMEVRIARGPEEMGILSPPELPPSEGATGVAYPSIRLIVLSSAAGVTYAKSDLAESLRRHLARVALHEATNGQSLPDWVSAGIAAHLADERRWAHDWLLLRAGLRSDWVPLFESSGLSPESSRRNVHELRLAAVEGEDFIAHLLALGRSRFPTVVEAVRQGRALPSALREGYGQDANGLEADWRRQLARRMTVAVVTLVLTIPMAGFMLVFGLRWMRRRRVGNSASEFVPKRRGPPTLASNRARVHIVLNPRDDISSEELPPDLQADVPKVEHEGEWHTLH